MVLCSSCKKTICRKMIINLNLLLQVNRREHRGGKILVKSWSLEGVARWAEFYLRAVTKHTLIKPPSPPKWWEFVTEVWFWHFDSSSTDFVFPHFLALFSFESIHVKSSLSFTPFNQILQHNVFWIVERGCCFCCCCCMCKVPASNFPHK